MYDLQPRTIPELLDRAFYLAFHEFRAVLALYVLPGIVSSVASEQLYRRSETTSGSAEAFWFLGVIFLNTIVLSLCGYALTDFLEKSTLGRRASFSESIQVTARFGLRVIGTGTLVMVLFLGGMLLFVVPGFYVLLAFFVVTPVMVLERQFGLRALRRSAVLLRGEKRRVVLLLIVYFAAEIGFALALDLTGAAAVLRDVTSGLFSTLLGAVITAFALLFYLDLRGRKEAFDVERLAQVVEVRAARER